MKENDRLPLVRSGSQVVNAEPAGRCELRGDAVEMADRIAWLCDEEIAGQEAAAPIRQIPCLHLRMLMKRDERVKHVSPDDSKQAGRDGNQYGNNVSCQKTSADGVSASLLLHPPLPALPLKLVFVIERIHDQPQL